MLKPGDIVVYIGPSEHEAGIKYGDIFKLIDLYHSDCLLMGDVGLKLPLDATHTKCDICGNKICSEKWLVYAVSLRKASHVECMNFEISEALKAPTPIRKFVITSEEEFRAMMEYGKTYLKQKLTIKFTDNFNFDE